MKKSTMSLALIGMLATGAACAAGPAGGVFKYVDEKSGQVIYSNVPQKGMKGDKLDILAYPVLENNPGMRKKVSAPGFALGGVAPNAAAIPPEVLRAVQQQMANGGGAERSPLPPMALPALPSIPGIPPQEVAAMMGQSSDGAGPQAQPPQAHFPATSNPEPNPAQAPVPMQTTGMPQQGLSPVRAAATAPFTTASNPTPNMAQAPIPMQTMSMPQQGPSPARAMPFSADPFKK